MGCAMHLKKTAKYRQRGVTETTHWLLRCIEGVAPQPLLEAFSKFSGKFFKASMTGVFLVMMHTSGAQ